MPLQFAITLFLSASLLFMVQPMVGKMVLPLLGGSPAVWNACMVFFQGLLLLGYLYAHKLTTKFDPKKQWMIHLGVLAVPIGLMALSAAFSTRNSPIAIAESLAPGGDTNPLLSVMAILTVAIGIPFFVASTSAPLLQKWFANTGHPSARDPYFLYAASNAGSLIFLLGYPLIIEPNMAIVPQTWVWATGFTILAVMIFICGRMAMNPLIVPSSMAKQAAKSESASQSEPPPTGMRKAKWIMLAFVPSSLMLGVTFHMTTDIASIPLLWVGPLALYLLTFIIAFSTIVPPWFRLVIGNLAPVMILLLVFVLISNVAPGVDIELGLHMLTFFAAAMMCHYELARDRPSPEHLTGYFLLMSVGGVLGGLFNALIAPIIFAQSYEYRLTLIFACFMVPILTAVDVESAKSNTMRAARGGGMLLKWLSEIGIGSTAFRQRQAGEAVTLAGRRGQVAFGLDVFIPILVGLGFWGFLQLSSVDWYVRMCVSIAKTLSIDPPTVNVIVRFAVPVMVCFFFVDRPIRFGLCVAAILGVSMFHERDRDVVYSERSFFGILKVERESKVLVSSAVDAEGNRIILGRIEYLRLVHGTTLHGTQMKSLENHVLDHFQMVPTIVSPWDALAIGGSIASFDVRQEPLTYYHRTGPVGAMFHELRVRKNGADAKADFAMIGLGTGSVSCYALSGQRLTFYEIDPAVKRLVADTDEYFTFVKDAERRGAIVDFRMGDARLKIKEDSDRKYTLLLVDAFSSDSIPVHLLTREAVQLYMDRITDDGILALHISNKFVALEPVCAQIALDLGLEARVWNDHGESRPGKTASSWVVLARKKEHLGSLAATQPEQVAAFVDPSSPLMSMYRKYGEKTSLRTAMQSEYGSQVEIIFEIMQRHPSMDVPLKWILKQEDTEQLAKAQKLKETQSGDTLVKTVISKRLIDKPEELEPALKSYGDTLTVQKHWENQGGPRVDMLRRLVAKYAVGDPEATDPTELPKTGITLPEVFFLEYDLRFIELASIFNQRVPLEFTIGQALERKHKELFHPLKIVPDVPTWTDDYSDVLRVMMLPGVQKIRGWFGLPNKLE